LTLRTLFNKRLFVQTKWLTSISTRRLCSVSGSKSAENVWNDGRTITGWFTVTCQHTWLGECSNFWPLKICLWPPKLPAHLTWPLVTSPCSPEWRCSYKDIQYSVTVTDCTTHNSKMSVLAVTGTMYLLHKLSKGHFGGEITKHYWFNPYKHTGRWDALSQTLFNCFNILCNIYPDQILFKLSSTTNLMFPLISCSYYCSETRMVQLASNTNANYTSWNMAANHLWPWDLKICYSWTINYYF